MQKKLNTFHQVRSLQGWQAIAFATALTERMQPNYELFCEVSAFADPAQFRNTLNLIWEWLASSKTKINCTVQLENLELVTPDAADHDNYGVFPAIDAAVSLAAILQLINGEDPQGAVIVSKLSQGGVESFIEATSEQSLTGQALREHPLMQWEIALQQELLDVLASSKASPALVNQLTALVCEEGISNIGIERG